MHETAAATAPVRRLHLALLAACLAVLVWSGINPYDVPTWAMEVAPVVIAIPLLFFSYNRFRLTDMAYVLIFIHAIILMVGGHYTYARVPLFDWIRDVTGGQRNSYDGVGHFAQGFVPAMIGRELLLRTSPLRPGFWMFLLIVMSCLGIAAIYEVLEWFAALMGGLAASEFLGTQGDEWDTQKDMALCGVGAVCALIALSRWHDRQLQRVL